MENVKALIVRLDARDCEEVAGVDDVGLEVSGEPLICDKLCCSPLLSTAIQALVAWPRDCEGVVDIDELGLEVSPEGFVVSSCSVIWLEIASGRWELAPSMLGARVRDCEGVGSLAVPLAD
ncbi:hypothetical protein N9L68_07630 [bacterium]|nr:hypothetical protein [bacterium]